MGMSAPYAGQAAAGPPQGAVLITRVEGPPTRYQLSLFSSHPSIEVASAAAAWSLAQGFAATQGVEVWFTSGDVSLAHAPEARPGLGRSSGDGHVHVVPTSRLVLDEHGVD